MRVGAGASVLLVFRFCISQIKTAMFVVYLGPYSHRIGLVTDKLDTNYSVLDLAFHKAYHSSNKKTNYSPVYLLRPGRLISRS